MQILNHSLSEPIICSLIFISNWSTLSIYVITWYTCRVEINVLWWSKVLYANLFIRQHAKLWDERSYSCKCYLFNLVWVCRSKLRDYNIESMYFWHWTLQGFDEYMNLVLDDAEEVSIKKKSRKPLGMYRYHHFWSFDYNQKLHFWSFCHEEVILTKTYFQKYLLENS